MTQDRIPYDIFREAKRIPEGDSLAKATRKYNEGKASLRKKSKSLSELLLDVPLVAEDVIAISEEVSQTDGFFVGSESHLEIFAAYARDSSSKIHLSFHGNSILCSGNSFVAKIPCYEEVRDSSNGDFYIPRSLGETEEAIQIQIVSAEGKLLRTERSISYNRYK